jgi:hypothetical protein
MDSRGSVCRWALGVVMLTKVRWCSKSSDMVGTRHSTAGAAGEEKNERVVGQGAGTGNSGKASCGRRAAKAGGVASSGAGVRKKPRGMATRKWNGKGANKIVEVVRRPPVTLR